jgi:hypothetical protein
MQSRRQKNSGQREQNGEEEINQETPSGAKLALIPKNCVHPADGPFWRTDRGLRRRVFRILF